MLDGRVFLSLALFFAFASKNSRCSTYILHAVSSNLYWEQSSCNVLSSEEDNFPSLRNFFIWTLRRCLSIPSPVDVAVVNGRYTPGKTASRAGTGERLTGIPIVQPSFLHPSQAGVQENFRYSRKYWPWRPCSSFVFWSFSNKAFPHIDVLLCKEDLFHLIRYLAKKNKICFSWGYLVREIRKSCFPGPGSSLIREETALLPLLRFVKKSAKTNPPPCKY